MTIGSTTSTSEPLLDLRGLVAGIRWRRRIWASLALLGLLAGALLTVLLPPAPTAVARVLIVRADDQAANRETLMETDVALFETTEIAGAALKDLNVGVPPGAFLGSYDGVALTANVMEITARGSSGGDAVRRAQALADAFIANRIRRTQDTADAEAEALLDRRARLERLLEEVTNTISSTTTQGAATDPQSPEALDRTAQLDALYGRRADLASQILELGRLSEEARIGAPRVAAGTRIVDPPSAVPTSLPVLGATSAVLGLVLGLGAGLALAAVLCVTRDRPILRRDIAAHLGVSVIIQLPASRRGPRERRRAATTLARVVRDAPGSVSLLEIGCPGTVAALALDIAGELAPERPVTIVDNLDGGHLRKAGGEAPSQAKIVDLADLRADRPSPAQGRGHCLGVGSVGPGKSWVDVGELGSETLLVVRAGHASTLWLHTVARQLAYADISAIGVVLVQPDPRDRSDGTLWDGLHTALRGRRASNSAMPVRQPVASRNGQLAAEPPSTVDDVEVP